MLDISYKEFIEEVFDIIDETMMMEDHTIKEGIGRVEYEWLEGSQQSITHKFIVQIIICRISIEKNCEIKRDIENTTKCLNDKNIEKIIGDFSSEDIHYLKKDLQIILNSKVILKALSDNRINFLKNL